MKIKLFLIALCGIYIPVQSTKNDNSRLLPTTITPFEYTIKLTPYLDIEDAEKAFTFDGEISILLQSTEDNIQEIVMFSKFIDNVKEIDSKPDINIVNISHESDDILRLRLNNALEKFRNYTFTLSYKGILQDDMTGFYKSSYMENGTRRWLATTQFQSNDARKAFPCFDEPSYKTIFKISIDCPVNYNCISNMPEMDRNGNLVIFHPTPLMSSYIIAFVVSEFIPIKQTEDKLFAIWGRKEANMMADYAFEVGPKLVEEFDNYLGVPYYDMDQKIKMDHVAISDFWAGAMENWGLITYKESYLMYHPSESSTKHKLRTIYVMAHEIAHMWFGNLVTCRYWIDVWLNEGFASYFQYHLTDKVENYDLRDQYLIDQFQPSFLGDQLLTAESNHEVTPRKGAAVIRMIEHLLKPEEFVHGLNHYLVTNSYKTVTPEDLYKAFDEKSNLISYDTTVQDLMGSFISQTGYPVLIVHVEQNTGDITLTQHNFNENLEDYIYQIPISYAYQNGEPDFENTKPMFVMKGRNETFNIPANPGWVIFNIQQTGYYRVMYDEQTLKLLIESLKNSKEKIHRYNRAQIVDDAFNLAREGHIDYSTMLDVIKFLEKENEYAPWSAAFPGLAFMRLRLSKLENIYEEFNKYILKMMNFVVGTVGLEVKEDDSNLMRIFRANTLNLACELYHTECVSDSIKKFKLLVESGTSVNQDLREHVYCNALRHGNEDSFDFLWNKYENENVINEKTGILTALGCTNNQGKIMEYLLKTIDLESGIRDQDRMTAYNSALMSNVENAVTALEFFMKNTQMIKLVYGSSGLNTMIVNLSSRLSNDSLNQFENYVSESEDLTETEKFLAMTSVENSRKAIDWAINIEDEIRLWILKNSGLSIVASFNMIFITLFAFLIKYV